MKELRSQQDYWNSRAGNWDSYDAPLIPGHQDLQFIRKHLVQGGNVLILGATPELCSTALEVTDKVTAVDFAKDVIEALEIEGVKYECRDWNEFFEQESEQFDTIMTDGGALCLEFPKKWRQLADNVGSHLKPNGIFAARVYISTPEPPKDSYENPNLARFVSAIARVDDNYMVRVQTHDDYKNYDVRYAFPPENEVLRIFGRLALVDNLVPDYEEGERFVSYAWQRSGV